MPIDTDGTLETEDQVIAAFEELFKDKEDAETPSPPKSDAEDKPTEDNSDDEANDETKDAETPSEDDESDEDATEEESTDEDDSETEKKKYTDDDDTYTKIKVGDEEHEVSVKELKRLWGQEKALTQKSQEVAKQTKKAEEDTARALAALDVMVKRAQEASKPYREMN